MTKSQNLHHPKTKTITASVAYDMGLLLGIQFYLFSASSKASKFGMGSVHIACEI